MADDEIERLLREVAASTGGGSASPGRTNQSQPGHDPGNELARSRGSAAGGRLAFAGIAAAAMGVIGWAAGLILPLVGAESAGVGAACGAFVTALIAGPPRWFTR
ncbi:MAG: hypothetical protein ACKOE2_15330 [Actinomycetales bacterium]